jgi:hypothetical protein
MKRAVCWTVLLLAASGCRSHPAAPCELAGAAAGQWAYTAWQEVPATATREGVLEIEAQACPELRGRIDVVETDGTGAYRQRIVAPVYGVRSSGGARLDVIIGSTSIEHAAAVRADSMLGTWVTTANGRIVASGRFGARKRREP